MLKKTYYKLGAAITIGLTAGVTDSAQAGNNFSTISSNITESVADLPGLLAAISYLFGVLIGVLGIMKIKDHVENPTQTPLKDGAIRLAAGGALFALPIVYEAMEATLNSGSPGDAADSAQLNKVRFTTL